MKLHYTIKGEGEPLLILHGLYGMSDNWMTVARKLESRFKIILPDLRNHGRSGFSEDHSYDSMVEDIHELLADLSITKTILLGHSMGGKVAMLFALKYPEKVSRLIVVDIAPKNYLNATNFGAETANHDDILNNLLSQDPSKAKSRPELDRMFQQHFKNAALRAFLLKNIERNASGDFEWRLNLPVLKQNLAHILNGFSNEKRECLSEALFVRGSLSPYINPDDLFYIKKFFPRAQLVTINNAGHWLHVQQPVLLVNTILFFLA